ncbi:hypothetical protein [Streptomyces sp. NBC_01244]|uniref:hypothetical protein n=1 Tax=Streptomyces sp. NBC_01244 TaxID=2903797 RepID=UPI002E0F1765|nr:hypothetical protein OG247_43830 [Streptomyces sp. NBC_01244]
MPQPLPRRPLEDQPAERIAWDAFAVDADVTAMYGQPSPALMARTKRGWQRLGSLPARIDPAGRDNDQDDGAEEQ